MFCGGFQLQTHNLAISVGSVLQGALRPPKLGFGKYHTVDLHDRRSIRLKGLVGGVRTDLDVAGSQRPSR